MNLIIGAISNYDYNTLSPFFSSLGKANFVGDVVMFTHNMSGVAPKTIISVPFVPNSLQIHDRRFVLALDYIMNHKEYDNILICDVRDVIFQADPFTRGLLSGLHCFLEDKSMTIGSCPFNSSWIRNTFGIEVLKEIGENYISCCGVTIGDRASIIEYLKLMNTFIYPGRPGPTIGVDTAAHNYILRKNLMPATITTNGEGQVLTMGYMKKINFSNGQLYNNDGSIPSIVHQYDRHKNITEQIQNIYLSEKI